MLGRLKRLFKHRWQDDNSATRVVPPAMVQRLQARVAASEQDHSGEIRIYVEAGLPMSYLWRDASTREITRDRALSLFGKLRVWDLEANNGVLIYLQLAEHAIEIVADRGLHGYVGGAQWQAMVAGMSAHFKQGKFEDGLTDALAEVSALLVAHFPQAANASQTNEMTDEPTLG